MTVGSFGEVAMVGGVVCAKSEEQKIKEEISRREIGAGRGRCEWFRDAAFCFDVLVSLKII
jgi:hypothetical protein